MDLSEKWPLEEGTWLSHAGMHHYANTRLGMAAVDVPDRCGSLQLQHSLCQPSCAQPSAVCHFKSSWLERGEVVDMGVRQTWVQILIPCLQAMWP